MVNFSTTFYYCSLNVYLCICSYDSTLDLYMSSGMTDILVQNDWLFNYNEQLSMSCDIKFDANGTANTSSHSCYHWKIDYHNVLTLFIKDADLDNPTGYLVVYRGEITDNRIIGKAFCWNNKRTWRWNAEIIEKQNVIERKKVRVADLLNYTYILKNDTIELDDDIIEFKDQSILKSKNYDRGSWRIQDENTLVFRLANNFITYACQYADNQLKGDARNVIGQQWGFTLQVKESKKHSSTHIVQIAKPKRSRKTIVSNPESPLQYIPGQSIFKVHEERKNGFIYFALDDYYPKKHFKDNNWINNDVDIIKVRNDIYAFKDGNNQEYFITRLYGAIKNEPFFDDFLSSNTVLVPIPASTRAKNEIRFRNFVKGLSHRLGLIDGMDSITIRYDREELKGKNALDKISNLEFNGSMVFNKNVILLDDLITRGTGFVQCAQKLKELGAKNVVGVFIGKTTWGSW